jgi:NAD-dependent dihydropyrimidine dehydrogenase PreA subunit
MPPVINGARCTKCGICADICTEDVFFGSKKGDVPVITYPDFCMYCNCCIDDCQSAGAISLRIPPNLMLVYK